MPTAAEVPSRRDQLKEQIHQIDERLGSLRSRQTVVSGDLEKVIHREERALRLFSDADRDEKRKIDAQLGSVFDQPLLDFDDIRHRYRQPDALSQASGQQLIRQHAQMLRIILKLHHVEVPVVGAHQMRLRSSAHSSHVLDSFYRHGGIVLALSTQPNNRTAKIAKIAKEQKVNQLSGGCVLSG